MAELFAPAPATPSTIDVGDASDNPFNTPLPLVALVLGVSGVVLGITVIWFFAAIPVGMVAVAIGVVARRRIESHDDPRGASRATIAIALGCVAMLLGVTGAIFLPRVMDRADRFLGTMQQSVNTDVATVNSGLERDVDRLDRTLSRDLRRFERSNHQNLTDLENRTSASLKALEDRTHGDVDQATVAAKRDLAALETALAADLHTVDSDMHAADSVLHDTITALEARVARIEKKLGL